MLPLVASKASFLLLSSLLFFSTAVPSYLQDSIAVSEYPFRYVVGISSGPLVNPLPEIAVKERIVMTSKNGKKFQCLIPLRSEDIPDAKDLRVGEENMKDAGISFSIAESSSSEDTRVYPDSIEEIDFQSFFFSWESKLKLLFSKCIVKKQGYWTYEVCPFEQISQYHLDDKNARDPMFSLGLYDAAASLQRGKKALDEISSAKDFKLMDFKYSQEFKAGTNGRKTIVRFLCPDWIQKGDVFPPKNWKNNRIVRVLEQETLQYEIHVETSFACLEYDFSMKSLSVLDLEKTKTQRDSISTPEDKSFRLLQPLDGTCIAHQNGFWTFKICFWSAVSQFHLEQVKKVDETGKEILQTRSTHEYDLGAFVPGSGTLSGATDPSEAFFSVKFEGGTLCDLVDQRRSTEVRFRCDEKASFPSIVSILETSTCNYLAIIDTALICPHSAFITDRPEILQIQCEPLDDLYYV